MQLTAKINCLELLFCTFSEVHIPNAVYLEVTTTRKRLDTQRIELFIEKYQDAQCFIHADLNDDHYAVFKNRLDEGESQALALASNLGCSVLIDERLGRRIAEQHSIPVVGIMGVLLKAKEAGEIEKIKPLIDDLILNKSRLSGRVTNIVLARAGELE
jgi:predicted nucleic acid-binding protein